jgi:hypothetical protein
LREKPVYSGMRHAQLVELLERADRRVADFSS